MSDELTQLEDRLLSNPAARARFLADTLDLLQRNGVDVNSPDVQEQMKTAMDLTEGSRFLGGLAASSVVIVAASAGQRGASGVGSNIGRAASSVVIAVASAGQRGASGVGSNIGRAASSVVIVAATAGQRGMGGGGLGDIGRAASSVVIVAATAGQRGGLAGQGIGNAASSVVVAIASAGQRGATPATGGLAGQGIGNVASSVVIAIATAGQRGALPSVGGMESAPEVQVTVPTSTTLNEIAVGLRTLADLLESESDELKKQIAALVQPSGTPDTVA
jgi:hypothetical protein